MRGIVGARPGPRSPALVFIYPSFVSGARNSSQRGPRLPGRPEGAHQGQRGRPGSSGEGFLEGGGSFQNEGPGPPLFRTSLHPEDGGPGPKGGTFQLLSAHLAGRPLP